MSGSVVERLRTAQRFPNLKLQLDYEERGLVLAAVEAARDYVNGGYREDAKRALDALFATAPEGE